MLRGENLPALLERAGIARERMVDQGLQFVRRADELGRIYFISNPGATTIDGWVPLDMRAQALTVFEPMHGTRGSARVRHTGAGTVEAYLQVPAGGSLLLAASAAPDPRRFDTYATAASPADIAGPWAVRFVKGGPALPADRTIQRLISWTEFGGEDEQRFSGTATYSTSFPRPAAQADAWRLDLGSVHESARIRLNGRDLGVLIGPTYTIAIDPMRLQIDNVLVVSVTNLSANRIADLDRRGVAWKKFYNVNYPARLAENRDADGLFTARGWKPLVSGLIGPVTLTPLRLKR